MAKTHRCEFGAALEPCGIGHVVSGETGQYPPLDVAVIIPGALKGQLVGAWRSLVAHLNGVQEAERSNRSAPTKH